MSLKLSSLLQWSPNVFMYRLLGWHAASAYLMFICRIYFFLSRGEQKKINDAIDAVFSDRKNDYSKGVIKKNVRYGIMAHYYEKFFNAYESLDNLKKFFQESIEVDCLYKFDKALEKGRGVLFVTGHYGGVEYIPFFLSSKKYPISAIAKFGTNRLKEFSALKAEEFGLKIIDGNEKNRVFITIIKELRDNRIVFTQCDEIEEWKCSRKERILFLKRLVGVDRTINIIKKRSNAEVIFGIMHRDSLRKYNLILESYLDMQAQLEITNSSVGKTILKFFEQYINAFPEGWYQWKHYWEIGMSPEYVSIAEMGDPIPILNSLS